MGFKHSNCIVVLNKEKDKVLFCKRVRDPYKGLYNFVGGKVEQGEVSEMAAYRELQEETGITGNEITLYRLMDLTYYHLNFVLEIYVGILKRDVELTVEVNPLEWLSLNEDFTDRNRFAGEQNIAHIINIALQYPFPTYLLKTDGIYLGIDGCKSGWTTAVYEAGDLRIEKYVSVEEIFKKYPNFTDAFIDMVIGLPDNSTDIRPDHAARMIVKPRTSTIFAVPSRQAVYAETGEKQIEANRKALGKSLSKQTMAIIPKMRELDQFLDKHRNYANAIKESHPEVCFARLNGTVVMTKKDEDEGLAQRVVILEKYLPELTVSYVKQKAKILKCTADDIVDAIVLAVTANLNDQGLCEAIPENVMEDAKGLRMQMVIPKRSI